MSPSRVLPGRGTVSRLSCCLGYCIPIALAIVLFGLVAPPAVAQLAEPVLSLARKEKPALLDTLKELVSIETGSRDLEGLERSASLIENRLRSLGGKVDL